MTFPTIPTSGAGRILSSLNTAGGATSTFPDLGSLTKDAGDLLIAIIVEYDGNSTNAEFSSWGGGFTEFVDQATTATMGIGAAYKWSDGTETGTFTVTTADTTTNDRAMILMSIPGAHASTPPEGGTIANGTTGAANIPSLDPSGWDVEDTLWIAVGGCGETNTTGSFTGVASAPANYGDYFDTGISADVVGGVEGAVAFRTLRAASDDPATFSVDVSNARNSSLLIAVRPAVPDPLGPSVTAFETTDWTGTGTPKFITVNGAVAGDLIVVMYGGDNGTGGGNVSAATASTNTGSTTSWSEPEEGLATTNQAWVSSAVAEVTADGSVVVQLDRTQASGQPWGGMALLCHNHGGIGTHGRSAPSAAETQSLAVEQNSVVGMIAIDWDDLAVVGFSPSGANEVERTQAAQVSNYAAYWLEQAAGTRGYGIGTSSTTNLHIIAIEVLAAAAGEPVLPPAELVVRQAVNRAANF